MRNARAREGLARARVSDDDLESAVLVSADRRGERCAHRPLEGRRRVLHRRDGVDVNRTCDGDAGDASERRQDDMTLDADDLPDEMDLASSEYLHSFTFRLRGREKVFLQKIDHALEKIKEGTFGVCEQCGEPISLKRLEARLETTLCIRCKEDQERIEKAYG